MRYAADPAGSPSFSVTRTHELTQPNESSTIRLDWLLYIKACILTIGLECKPSSSPSVEKVGGKKSASKSSLIYEYTLPSVKSNTCILPILVPTIASVSVGMVTHVTRSSMGVSRYHTFLPLDRSYTTVMYLSSSSHLRAYATAAHVSGFESTVVIAVVSMLEGMYLSSSSYGIVICDLNS